MRQPSLVGAQQQERIILVLVVFIKCCAWRSLLQSLRQPSLLLSIPTFRRWRCSHTRSSVLFAAEDGEGSLIRSRRMPYFGFRPSAIDFDLFIDLSTN